MKYTTLAVAAFIALTTQSVSAAEGGMGLYPLGLVSPQAGMMPPAGNYLSYNFWYYNGDAHVNASLSKPIPFPGSNLQITANGEVKANVNIYANLLSLTHVFDDSMFGANPALSVNLSYVDAKLDVTGNGTLTLDNPKNPTSPVLVSTTGEIKATDNALGDSVLTGLLGWHQGFCHTIALLNVYVPTGSYHKDQVLNVGKNHWAVEPMINFTYLNENNGIEVSTATGITFNAENTATDYRTGNEFHIDLSVIQHLSKMFYVGLAGYAYNQLSDDSGSGAPGPFKGRVLGGGPIVGGIIPISITQLILNGRFYTETDIENRFKGQSFFFTAVLPLG